MIQAYIDASTQNAYGPSGAGILLIENGAQRQLSFPLAPMSNHEAEFATLLLLLQLLLKEKREKEALYVYSDSKIVVAILEKNHTTNPQFSAYLDEINLLLPAFELFILQWIEEKKNKGADNLARQGLQKALRR